MEDLIFLPLQVRCPGCCAFANVTLESLDDNEEIICEKCSLIFTPEIDVDKLINLMKTAEKIGFTKTDPVNNDK